MNKFIFKLFILTFILSILFSGIINLISHNTGQIVHLIIIVAVIVIAIIFDMVSTASLTSKEASFHAMNSRRVKGAKEAIYLIKNNAKVVGICSDLIGDVLGIASGGLGVVLAISISISNGFNLALTTVLISAFISAFTVGGKALFKEVAIKNSDKIIYICGKLISILKFK